MAPRHRMARRRRGSRWREELPLGRVQERLKGVHTKAADETRVGWDDPKHADLVLELRLSLLAVHWPMLPKEPVETAADHKQPQRAEPHEPVEWIVHDQPAVRSPLCALGFRILAHDWHEREEHVVRCLCAPQELDSKEDLPGMVGLNI